MVKANEDIVAQQYTDLSNYYHYFFENWYKSSLEQGKQLNKVFNKYGFDKRNSILDCTCGIGTQIIGLLYQGYEDIVGNDISIGQINRAKEEIANNFKIDVSLYIEDVRNINSCIKEKFDIVISCANSLTLLGNDEKIKQALVAIYNQLNLGGMILISMRDHSNIIDSKPSVFQYDVVPTLDENIRKVWFETIKWLPDGKSYYSNIYFFLEGKSGVRDLKTFFFPPVRALTSEESINLLKEVGFEDIEFLDEKSNEYKRPIFIGFKK